MELEGEPSASAGPVRGADHPRTNLPSVTGPRHTQLTGNQAVTMGRRR